MTLQNGDGQMIGQSGDGQRGEKKESVSLVWGEEEFEPSFWKKKKKEYLSAGVANVFEVTFHQFHCITVRT